MPILNRRSGRPWPVLAGLLAVAGCLPFSGERGDAPGETAAGSPSGTTSSQSQAGAQDALPDMGVQGRVATGGGPVSGVFVQAAADGPGGPIPELAVFTGADGGFFYPLRPGNYILSFTKDGTVIAVRSVQVPADRGLRLEVTVE